MLIILMSFLAQLYSQVYTADGYAYLEDETNYRGINVVFQRVIPDSLALYRVSTDSTGYFLVDVEPGYYDVTYSKNGFSSIKIEDAVLYSDQTLADQTLTVRGLEGEIKGIITSGDYNVSATLRVLDGDSLFIEPGVILNFKDGSALIINGYLNAEGTGSDSIIFKPLSEEWLGIRFQQSSVSSSMKYCSIINIKETAVIVEESNLYLSNSAITTKKNGIYFWAAENCDVSNCEISAINPGGEGIYISPETVSEITFAKNRIQGFYDGVLVMGGSLLIENCVFSSNSYGLVLEYPSVVRVVNCNIKADIGIRANSTAKVYNTILQSLNNGHGEGISRAMVFYGTLDVFNTNLYGFATNFENCGPYLGVIVTTNASGDPCDGFFNISVNPIFTDGANGDFSLQSDSPCIDSGSNTITDYTFPSTDIVGNTRIWDGDDSGTSIVDMGAYEYGSSVPTSIEDISEEIHNYTLYQNYPNPFNPVTAISYALPQAGQVDLSVYNLNGQLVKSLVNGKQAQGMHKAELNGADLTSGMYIYNLKVDGKVVQSKKMMLLK